MTFTLKPLRVSCCENEEVEFTCTYESTKRLEIELYTIPPTFEPFPRKESSNGISAKIKLRMQLQKVVCVLKDNADGLKTLVVEASSYISKTII